MLMHEVTSGGNPRGAAGATVMSLEILFILLWLLASAPHWLPIPSSHWAGKSNCWSHTHRIRIPVLMCDLGESLHLEPQLLPSR